VPGLQRVGTALDQLGVERTAVAHLLDPLALQVVRGLNLREHRAAPDVGNQNPVVDLVDPQRGIVFHAARFSAAGLRLGARDVVGGFHPEKLRQGLKDAGSVGDRIHAPLVENQRLGRNRTAPDDSEPSGGNANQLRIRQADQRRVVPHLRKVGAPRDLFRAVLLIDRQLCETYRMVARKRQVDRFAKRETAGARRSGWLGKRRRRAGGQEQGEDRASKCHDGSLVRAGRALESSAASSRKFNGNLLSVAMTISVATAAQAMR
jgi:hypothetical protein